MKNIIITIVMLVSIGFGVYLFNRNNSDVKTPAVIDSSAIEKERNKNNTATTTVENKNETVIGKSVESRDIVAYHYGSGDTEILFVGGIHGGYEWNTSLLAYEAMDYFKSNPNAIPANIKVTVVPVVNPDGLKKVVSVEGMFKSSDVNASQSIQVAGRFNANNVDLNRNFDCDWQAEGVWQTRKVSGGTSAFSEPESLAIKNYIEIHNIKSAVVWYSAAGGVFASSCHNDVSSETKAITQIFAKASGYKAYESFDFYATTGDMVNWLAKKNIPAISVLLTNHTDTEFNKNKSGIEAILKYYAK